MKASEFINTYAFAIVSGLGGNRHTHTTVESLEKIYAEKYFFLPRLRCKDGFSISVQVHNGAYCASENGVRSFGVSWNEVEWGFPSQLIEGPEYNAEEEGTTQTVGGYVDISVIDTLIENHGGLDLEATLRG